MKKRLDVLLTEEGYFESREKAKTAIMAGEVSVDGRVFDKPGMSIPEDAEIKVNYSNLPYVSRGGLKLEKAISEFQLDLHDAICIDVGASTGGFTDCMLQNGALKVYAFDVGYGQLDYKIRSDERVVSVEKCNFRYFDNQGDNFIVKEPVDFISIDVSFISLKLIFPQCVPLLKTEGKVCALVKPQFEAGRGQVGKNGIVRDPNVHREVIDNVLHYGEEVGLYPEALCFSPIKGAKGNIEFLLLLNKEPKISYNNFVRTIATIVESSHKGE